MDTYTYPLFTEKQYIRSHWQAWLIVFVAIFFVGYATYKAYFDIINFNNYMFYILFIIDIFTLFFLCLFLYKGALVTHIYADGIYYTFFPVINKTRKIPMQSIVDFEVKECMYIKDFGGWGLRIGNVSIGAHFGSHKCVYHVYGRDGLKIKLRNTKTIIFGTHQPEKLRNAMGEMMKIKKT